MSVLSRGGIIATLGIVLAILMLDIHAVEIHCFKVYNRYQNGCTGMVVNQISDINDIKDTCCHDNDTAGQTAAGYAHLSQPLGFPGYFMCDRCPEVVSSMEHNNKTTSHHHHHRNQQHFMKKHQHKHQNYKKNLLKSWKQDIIPNPSISFLASRKDMDLKIGNEWYMKQEKKKMKLTNKTKPDKISNSVISETNDNKEHKAVLTTESTTTNIPVSSTTTIPGNNTNAKLRSTGSGVMITTKNYNHHHHHRHKHHHHHHPDRRRKSTNVGVSATSRKLHPQKRDDDDVGHIWSSWSDWTPCFDIGKSCIQRRTRFCLIASCPKSKGEDYQERKCANRQQTKCSQASTPKLKFSRKIEKHRTGFFPTTTLSTPPKGGTSVTAQAKSSTPHATTSDTRRDVEGDFKQHKKKTSNRLKSFEIKRSTPSTRITQPTKPGVLLSPLGKIENSKNEKQLNWSPWAPCSASCGEGIQIRKRMCVIIEHHHHHHHLLSLSSNHLAMKDQKSQLMNCSSETFERKPCLIKECSVNGNWSKWKVTVNCSSSPCSGKAGVITWSRECTNPPPSRGGRLCQGREWKREICYNNSGCSEKVDGGWCTWKNWVKSSKGSVRLRTCDCPPPANQGRHCQGPSEQTLNAAATTTTVTTATTTTTITKQRLINKHDPSIDCDGDLGSGDGSDVSCDQENIEKKSKHSPARPTKDNMIFEDEDYEDDDVANDEGSGSLK